MGDTAVAVRDKAIGNDESQNSKQRKEGTQNVKGMNKRPTRIPNTPAGQRCLDVLYYHAQKMVDEANEATGDFIQANFPGAKTTGKDYVDRKMKRTIECEDGSLVTVIYDYMTKTTKVEQ